MIGKDAHFEALLGLFFLLISPLLWLVLGGESLGIATNSTTAWVLFTTFAITAYLAFIAFVALDKHHTPRGKSTTKRKTARKK